MQLAQQQPLRSQSAVSSNEAFFSFSQPTMPSQPVPSGESAAAGWVPPNNLAHRSLPPQQAAPPAKRKPSFSRTETKAQMMDEYRAMYPGLVQNWGCMRTMRIPELRVIMAAQGEHYSKVSRTDMMNKLLLAQAGKLKPPAAAVAVPAAGSNGAKQKTAAGAAAAAAGGAAAERFSLTHEEDDSPKGEPEATSLSQGSAKRLKTTHSYTSAQQWQHLAAQRNDGKAPTSAATALAQQNALASADLDLAARSAAQPPWASASLVVHGEHFSRPNCALSPFILQAGTELVVSVHEYLRFRCAHQFAIDKLAQFKSDAVNPRGHRPTLMQLGESSGLVRARVSSLLPVIEADFYASNEHAN